MEFGAQEIRICSIHNSFKIPWGFTCFFIKFLRWVEVTILPLDLLEKCEVAHVVCIVDRFSVKTGFSSCCSTFFHSLVPFEYTLAFATSSSTVLLSLIDEGGEEGEFDFIEASLFLPFPSGWDFRGLTRNIN